MSAPVGTMAEDSSSEDEDLEHFKEAAWSFGTYGTNGTHNANPAGLEGFRLFTTSVPGEFTIDPPPPPVRRRPISSSSDSEIEMRLREAAVSVTDLLSSALPSEITHSLPESPSSEK
ncbi:protein CUSTOS isoform X2 [Oncorhynchus mykiss]|uniref:protein CUSTOS isoform X2 n=1 Tax=Oncorhynchus mykiss TaxID=8022 RepID=UPI001877DC95|nr:protein CUSTOS isoform X2 [Oncorhynchus mykiss]